MRLPVPADQLKKKLVQEGLITAERFDEIAVDAGRKNQDFLDLIISQGVAEQGYLNNTLAALLGVPLANLEERKVDPEVVKVLSEDIARQREVIIFDREPDGSYDAAMADPNNLETIKFLFQHLQAKVNPFFASNSDLNRGFAIYGSQSAKDFKKLIEENIQQSLAGQAKTIEEAASLLPIVSIVENLLSYAMASRSSDIHLEVLEDVTLVRYRVDGILFEIMRMPKAIHPALVARIKILSGLKIDEHFRPQDGRFHYQIATQMIDVRVSILPTFYGEKIVMRLLEAAQKPLSLEELGMLPETAKVITENLKKAYGMVLSVGPTGSGKTTTLYALMDILNRPNVNIVTVEDPIEYNMRYVNQTQINVQAGITFANGLRAILRQDPNIIMVGEIRDAETAGIAVQAALTGHLLLSSLHTNDAPTVVPRLFDLEVPPFLVVSVLNVIVAQRLVRRICHSCIYSYEVGQEVMGIIRSQLEELSLDPAKVKLPKNFFKGKGCPSCGMTGYRGRLGIFEALEINEQIKRIIIGPDFTLEKLRLAAREHGMTTMFEDGLKKVELAMTTLDEVLRVIRE
ncbi:MAG: type II/IV secretion system protein [Candidatus Liptonbacteria bacterium]|nr:type II/IV secretion system protein [Candidatus Liptonbacteria bacterium]